jgi:hypothetical protein
LWEKIRIGPLVFMLIVISFCIPMIASLAPDVYAQNNHDVSSSFTIWASSELT